MTSRLIDQVIALSGVCQAASLAQQIARNGECDQDALRTSLKSILITEPDSVEAVFGDKSQIMPGLAALLNQLQAQSSVKDVELTRYAINLLALERKMAGQRGLFTLLGERVAQVKRQVEHVDLLDSGPIANLASIYSELISPIGPRIQVSGAPTHLKQPDVQNRIRATLLAGIRAAVLWRQVGGKRRQLLLSRKKIIDTGQYLKQLISQ